MASQQVTVQLNRLGTQPRPFLDPVVGELTEQRPASLRVDQARRLQRRGPLIPLI
jgi:hypothetical protein